MNYIKPSFLIITLICGYFIFILNINYFFDNLDNRFVSYENNFESETTENNVVEKIFSNSEIAVANEEDLKEILSSPFLINLLGQLLNYSEEETIEFITKYIDKLMVNTMKIPEYDSKIIYIDIDGSLITFTLDGKNIMYNRYLSGESCTNNSNLKYDHQGNINRVETEVNAIFKKLNITKISDFSITSIVYRGGEYSYSTGEIYDIEDANNNIKATYSLECSLLYSLSIGFNK